MYKKNQNTRKLSVSFLLFLCINFTFLQVIGCEEDTKKSTSSTSTSTGDSLSAPESIAYTEASYIFDAFSDITAIEATIVGEEVSVTITPDLPDGLSIDDEGTISGNATINSDETEYTVTATNDEGSAETTVTLTARVSFANQVGNRMVTTCSGCHSPGGGETPHWDSLENIYANAVGVDSGGAGLYIEAGNSADSYVFQRIRDDEMPDGGPYWSAANKALIEKWIDQGALDN